MFGPAMLLIMLLSAPQAPASACTYQLTVTPAGRIYLGHHVRVSRSTLITDLKNGCHNGPVTQVTLAASPQTPYGKVKDLIDLVHQYAPPETQLEVLTPTH